MKRRLLCCSLILLGALIVASFLEPFQIVPGLLHGDAFYDFRPARYWREVLRKAGETGHIPEGTLPFLFLGSSASVPVLRQCLEDPDRNVRWPAALLLRHRGRDPQVVSLFCRALHDDDPEVRLQAVQGLLRSDGKFAEATQGLVEVMKNDPEVQVQHWAEKVLWWTNTKAAREARGWQRYVSKKWNFSVDAPEQPQISEPIFQTAAGPVSGHGFQFLMGAVVFSVIVSEYPKEFVESTPEEQRNLGLRESVPFFFQGGKIISENCVEIQGHKGVEFRIEFHDMEILQRHFWVGHRLYAVMLVFNDEFVIPEAAKYFLESFRFEPAG